MTPHSTGPTPEPESSPALPRRVLTLTDCIGIIVGTIIGAGIFAMPSVVASHLPNVQWLVAAWLGGGLIALMGALCFAELTTTYPDLGGDYGYLKRGYHRQVGFAFSWAAFWVIRPGNIGAMAMIFGMFAEQAIPGWLSPLGFALLSVGTMTATNLLGVTFGKTTQNILVLAKVVGILLVVGAALWIGGGIGGGIGGEPVGAGALRDSLSVVESGAESVVESGATEGSTWSSFWLAMVFVMFTYGGWNDIAFVASEVQDPKRNLVRSLLWGTVGVSVIYLLMNLALVSGLGFEELAALGSRWENPTTTLVAREFGPRGTRLLAVLVCVSCLGAINAMLFTSPRIYRATAQDYPMLGWLAGESGNRGRWWRAMLLQGFVTMVFVLIFGFQSQGIDRIVSATAPYFWVFLALTVVSLMVSRVRYQGQYSGFRVPLYPLLPLVFVAACFFMMVQSWIYMWDQGLWLATLLIGVWVLAGVGLSFALDRSTR